MRRHRRFYDLRKSRLGLALDISSLIQVHSQEFARISRQKSAPFSDYHLLASDTRLQTE